MGGRKITLIGLSPTVLGSAIVEQVLKHWPEDDRPIIEAVGLEKITHENAKLDKTGVAWVVLDEPQPPGLFSALGVLQDKHIPVLITRSDEDLATGDSPQEGVTVARPDEAPQTLCAVLRTLWSQSAVLRTLQHEIRFLHAHQGGLADQIDRMDEEMRLAAQLQREFLPLELPRVGPLEFKSLFRPASYVSGDIYDVIRLDENHVGVFIADAVGHGVPAALMTMYIKRALHTKTIDAAEPSGYRLLKPDEALASLNHDMCVQQSPGKIRFATAAYVVIDCRSMELSIARAGHPFPIIFHADGSNTALDPDGAMLGIFPEEVFELRTIKLRPADRFLMYSDGFELAFPKSAEALEDKMCLAGQPYCEEFRALALGSLDVALEGLVRKIEEQAGSLNQRDDMTAVCIEVREDAPPIIAEAGDRVLVKADRQ